MQKPVEGISDDPDAPSIMGLGRAPNISTAEIKDIGRFGYEPLIDEPVTGSGNDDLWTSNCDPGQANDCVAAKPKDGNTSP